VVLEQLTTLRSLFKFHSGRVIALGRVMLAITFLLAVMLGRSQSELAWAQTYLLLSLYAAGAIIIAIVTWRNWWLDARLATITHGIDMAVFTGIVFSANGTTSPFFLFFVLPLLSAAVRWSWRETALTASALIVLYMIAGFLIAGTQSFELERFVLRAGNLLILTLLLIWFGIHQRFSRTFLRIEETETALSGHENPLARALSVAMHASEARRGALIVGPVGEEPSDGFALEDDKGRSFIADQTLVGDPSKVEDSALLVDLTENRALTRPPEGRFRFLAASAVIDLGFAAPHRSSTTLYAAQAPALSPFASSAIPR